MQHEDSVHEHDHDHAHGHIHSHAHGHAHDEASRHAKHSHSHEHVAVDAASGDLHFGAGLAKVSVPGMSQSRAIRLEQDVLGENNRHAAHNREHFSGHGILALNLVSSPGSGKTTLLCATIEALKLRAGDLPVAVIEGDQQTSHDADRIRATGAPAIQINTGKGCHLDALMVSDAFSRLPLHHHHHHHDDHAETSGLDEGNHQGGILFIENVGNLVCPAMWDLGESAKVVILSVTEGEDKPLKYPDMFAAARLMVLNKTDLLPYLQFDVARCIEYAKRVNPQIEVLQLSASNGQGMSAWLDWIEEGHRSLIGSEASSSPVLADRIAALENELHALKAQAGRD
ncbi:hydrogenase nickel incorporation protein HypB [Herbaspirillum sp. RTI4]|nr:hydrogenase nickel incorporation protein HypB [Herbaspirillum sp. RTI4]MDY7577061.1 hydrogenase nickel incorporation protein HypB [Herbaspirillum sp. RTI4]MEA9982241.1 hydrogenase nickel incorporation protein HypB [Herbaspirillum sp. RTI4]